VPLSKPLSEARWECRTESVKAIQLPVTNFHAVLVETGNTICDNVFKSEIISVKG
jgi:hypothetical protein